MNHLNSVLIEGNIAREPVLRETGGGYVCMFTVATDRFYKKDSIVEKEVSFFEIQAWGDIAEAASKFGYKGRGVRITGRNKQDRWKGPDGQPRSKIIVVAEKIELRPSNKTEDPVEKDKESSCEENSSTG